MLKKIQTVFQNKQKKELEKRKEFIQTTLKNIRLPYSILKVFLYLENSQENKKTTKEICLLKKESEDIIFDQKTQESLRKRKLSLHSKKTQALLLAYIEIIYKVKSKQLSKDIIQQGFDTWSYTADYLGIWKLRYLLEDTIFCFLKPKDCELIQSLIKEKEKTHKKLFRDIKDIIQGYLKKEGFCNTKILYRTKNIYGLYKKIKKEKKTINHISDFFGIRIIVNDKDECYKTLEILHYLWSPYKKRIKDFIAHPKENQYQSLHTTLQCLEKQTVEFQIRTKEMDAIAKFGPANHALYKEENYKSA